MGTRAWLPTDAGNTLLLWIDPSDAATLTVTGSRVAQARDKSGGNNTFVAALSGNGPLLTTVNGLNALYNDTSDTYQDYTKYAALISTTAALNSVTQGSNTIVCMAAASSGRGSRSDDQSGFALATPGASPTAFVSGWTCNVYAQRQARFAHGGSLTTSSTLMSPSGSLAVQTRSATSLVGYVDGTQASSLSNAQDIAPATGTWWINGWTDTATDQNVGGLSPAWTGDCLIYTGVLSTSDRQKLEGYLASKWGTQARLPAAHPYKSAAPTVSTGASYTATISGASGYRASGTRAPGKVLGAPTAAGVMLSRGALYRRGLYAGGASAAAALGPLRALPRTLAAQTSSSAALTRLSAFTRAIGAVSTARGTVASIAARARLFGASTVSAGNATRSASRTTLIAAASRAFGSVAGVGTRGRLLVASTAAAATRTASIAKTITSAAASSVGSLLAGASRTRLVAATSRFASRGTAAGARTRLLAGSTLAAASRTAGIAKTLTASIRLGARALIRRIIPAPPGRRLTLTNQGSRSTTLHNSGGRSITL